MTCLATYLRKSRTRILNHLALTPLAIITFPLRAKVTPIQILTQKGEVTCLKSLSLFGTGTGQPGPPTCSDWLQDTTFSRTQSLSIWEAVFFLWGQFKSLDFTLEPWSEEGNMKAGSLPV